VQMKRWRRVVEGRPKLKGEKRRELRVVAEVVAAAVGVAESYGHQKDWFGGQKRTVVGDESDDGRARGELQGICLSGR